MCPSNSKANVLGFFSLFFYYFFPLQPNRLKQFGLTARALEDEVPPERPRAAFQTPLGVPSASPGRQDFHRGLASTLGEIAAPRCFTSRSSWVSSQVVCCSACHYCWDRACAASSFSQQLLKAELS